MRWLDVLNRFPDLEDPHQTVHIMRHVFPRQFGLHNVFTSKVDTRETAMSFKDYTLREKEIHQSMCRELSDNVGSEEHVLKWKSHIPKRLRGDTVALVNKLRRLNQRCSYMELLRHYCPVKVTANRHTLQLAAKLTCEGPAFILQTGVEETPTSAERNGSRSCRVSAWR